MDFQNFEAGQNDNDRRIDKVIRVFCPQINLSSIYKYIRKGLIKVNNKKIPSDYRVKSGDIIKIAEFILNNSVESSAKMENGNFSDYEKASSELNIIFKNKDLLAVNKPYNMLVHGTSADKNTEKTTGKTTIIKNPSLEEIIRTEFKPESQSLSFTPGPLHRLDRKTTGLIFFSQSIDGARWFSENLRNHKIQKKYIGIVQGKLFKEQIWVDEISKNDDKTAENNIKNTFHTVQIKKTDNSKTAETIATPLYFGKYKNTDLTVVEFHIKTGRTHQIRSQSAAHGFPLLGDTAYNGKIIENESRDFYLHAQKVIFLNKMENSNLPSQIICNLDQDFLAFISKTCDIQNIEL